MTRKEFVRICGLLGIGIPFVASCDSLRNGTSIRATDKVVIVGAGAAGLTAAYLLSQKGIQVEVLEAGAHYGGRMKRTKEFADFPIPTGAEWLHTKRSVFDKIVNNKSIKVETKTKGYDKSMDYAWIDGQQVPLKELGFTIDQKFINTTWFDFFEEYIVPSIKDKILLNQVVNAIDYSKDKIIVSTESNSYTADRVIVTVPLKMLQKKTVQFIPDLPAEKKEAIQNTTVWDGFKAFIAFDHKFYPAATGFSNIPDEQGHKLFYDASYGQQTTQHILGVFAVGPIANPYLDRQGDDLIQYLLEELDRIYDGKATPSYQKHIFQNWSKEAYVESAYVHYYENWKNIRTLGKSIDDKLYFAGDAYTDGSDWSSVHAAANSAIRVIKDMLGSI